MSTRAQGLLWHERHIALSPETYRGRTPYHRQGVKQSDYSIALGRCKLVSVGASSRWRLFRFFLYFDVLEKLESLLLVAVHY